MFRYLILMGLVGLFLFPVPGSAGQKKPYVPDIAEFDGTNGIAVEADPGLTIRETGTIEFWVAPGWKKDPGYDPVVLSNAGPEGVLYLVSILADRKGIEVAAGDRSVYAAFDFTDDKMHYVAISDYEDELLIYIDAKLVGRFEGFSFKDLPSAGLWIGTGDGVSAPFKGAIAALRIWSYAIAPEDLILFSLKDVSADENNIHPALDYLQGISDFDNRDFYIAENSPPAE
ncbi:MAG: LamG domain-containing protein [Sneathiellales bacterium]|nr:LamG domain-containing protein [Sneathiellales bacterium]